MAKKAKKGTTKSKKATRKPMRRPAKKAQKRATRKTSRKAPKKRARPPVPTLRTPPSSLDLARQPSAARSGRRALQESQKQHSKMAAVTGGDVDADMESAYFTGDEAAGGDNPTPDQNDVGEIGHAMGVEYNDNQELRGGEEVADRDKHRWDTE